MQSPSPPVSASELASSWTPFPIITTNQLNTAARPTPAASQPKSDLKSDNRSLMRCRQSESVEVLPCWAKAESPGHLPEKEGKAPHLQGFQSWGPWGRMTCFKEVRGGSEEPPELFLMCRKQQKLCGDRVSVCQMLRGFQDGAGAGKCKLQNAGMNDNENGALFLLMWRPLSSVGVPPFLLVGI